MGGSSKDSLARPATPVPKPWKGHVRPEYLATSEEVQEVAYSKARGVLIDIRKLGEHDGSFRHNYWYDKCKIFDRAGHIPNSTYYGNWDELMQPSDTDSFMNLNEMRERLETLGCFKNQEKRGPLIFYCGTGWRSSIAFFLAYLLGCESKNYDDGFYGWSEDPTKEIRYSRPGTPVNEPSSV